MTTSWFRSMRAPGRWSAAVALAGLLLLGADFVGAAGGERDALAGERKRLQAAFAAEEAACAGNFAVNACLDGVRQRRRAALAPLRERELALDEAERRERAAERRRGNQARQAAAASRASAPAEPQMRVRAPSPAASRAAERHGSAGHQQRIEREAEKASGRAAAAEQRREQARLAQERVERRLQERAATGKVSAPLPIPASAASR